MHTEFRRRFTKGIRQTRPVIGLSAAGIGIFSLLLSLALPLRAQQQQEQQDNRSVRVSDLAEQNFSHVAASAIEIRAILLRDAGLMVEVKRLVAKDASDHGQVVSDQDLTDDAILERLEDDVAFRSIVTSVLQKYGYLLPQVNPNSEQGKEQALVMTERTKLIAEEIEAERADKREQQKQAAENMQKAATCAAQMQQNCAAGQAVPVPPGQIPAQNFQPLPARPYSPLQPGMTVPSGNPLIPLDQTQLLQASADQSSYLGATSQLSSLDGASLGGLSTGSMQNLAGGDDGQSRSRLAAAMAGGASLGGADVLGSYGLASGTGTGLDPSALAMLSASQGGAAFPGASSGDLTSMYGVSQMPIMQYRTQPTPQQPSMTRTRMPYGDIPSLYDMYVQAVARPATPARFGEAVFENGTRDLQLFPMDVPAGPDYVVGPGDGLVIDMWGGVSQRLSRVVDREGRISLPEVGPVLVSGKTLENLQQSLQQTLRSQYRDVSADVSLARLRTIRVYEVGDVANPGAYDISSLSTPLNGLFAAGGPTQQGSMRIVKHYRGDQLLETVDIYDLLLHGIRTELKPLENGDTIQVPPIGPQITVEGMVRRPAIYELKDEKNLASVLELAGGVLPTAALRHIEVQRVISHQKQTMLSLDIPEDNDDAQIAQKLESFQIQDGDRIRIFPIAPYNQDTIYVEGHVIRPGKYSYRTGMRVTDVVASYKDLLPEPSTQYAEIVRLNAPDFHPSVESFDLAAALADPSKAPVLQPMDTVRIFSKFDFENAPTVSVLGDVRAPGTYPTSGQVRLADALYLAGGLSPDAATESAQIFRYLPDGQSKIFSVSLAGALAGDPAANISLEPRDRILVHRNAESVQPSTVYIEGAVAKPGRYPLTENMRISDLIEVGGGLKPSADTSQADLVTHTSGEASPLAATHAPVPISAALSGDATSDVALHNGDVLTIREVSGWEDLGASIMVKGDVKHPGKYGIRPGERLSSIIERAGGFEPGAYPYGAILEREQVRELEAKSQDAMILRVKETQSSLELMPDSDPRQKQAKEATMQQWQTTLEQLAANPPVGRVNIRISSNLKTWQNTSADIEVRAGDTLIIPKRPGYVMVSGQVFNATAVTYRPSRSANWYLQQAGGPTQLADRKDIFVIRADGSVIGARKGLLTGSSLNAALQPGDTVVVPEKALGGPIQWQLVFGAASVASAVASTVYIAMHP